MMSFRSLTASTSSFRGEVRRGSGSDHAAVGRTRHSQAPEYSNGGGIAQPLGTVVGKTTGSLTTEHFPAGVGRKRESDELRTLCRENAYMDKGHVVRWSGLS